MSRARQAGLQVTQLQLHQQECNDARDIRTQKRHYILHRTVVCSGSACTVRSWRAEKEQRHKNIVTQRAEGITCKRGHQGQRVLKGTARPDVMRVSWTTRAEVRGSCYSGFDFCATTTACPLPLRAASRSVAEEQKLGNRQVKRGAK